MLSYQQPKIRILVVDDHELTRLSLKHLFASQQNFELVGLSSNGQQAIKQVQQHQPDVVILDLQMPVMHGLNAAFHIKRISPSTQIVAYSSLEDPQTEVMSQTAPIDCFCDKETSTEELIRIVNELGGYALPHA